MIFVYILFIVMPLSIAQDIVFPGDTIRQSRNETMEIKIKKECPINMEMIDDNGESECVCVSGYLYYPPLNRCFKPYTRESCNTGEYFMLQPGKLTGECLRNPCEEGFIPHHNICYKILKPGPPCDDEKSLVINDETFELSCQEVPENRNRPLYSVIAAPISRCPQDWKMDYTGKCRIGL